LHHQANWESLEVILPAQDAAYLIMGCESLSLRDELRKEVEKRFSHFDHLPQDYSAAHVSSLTATLSEQLPAHALSGTTPHIMVHLLYLENSLLLHHAEASGHLCQSLGSEAAALASAFPFLTVVWLDLHSIDYLRKYAPDFCQHALDIYLWWEEEAEEIPPSPYEQLTQWQQQLADPALQTKAAVCLQMGSLWEEHHSFQQAMIYYQRVLEYLQLETDSSPLGDTYLGMGRIMMHGGDYYQAQDYFRLALDCIDETDHTRTGDIHRYMGICQYHCRNSRAALALFERSNAAYQAAGDEEALAYNFQDMALVCRQAGQDEEAMRWLEKARDLSEKLEDEKWKREIEKSMQAYQPKASAPPSPPDYTAAGYATEKVPPKDPKMSRRGFLEKFTRRKK
ncbi:MAG: tetratricopeptide repeat protein, partial [Bacteroidetes bacterium]